MAVTSLKSYNSDNQAEVTSDHALKVTGDVTANNSSVGPLDDTAPTDATLIGGIDNSGDLKPAKITDEGKLLVDANVSGTIEPSGLQTAGRVTTLEVSTTAVELPAVPLLDRNAMSIRNLSTTDTLYIGFDTSVTADSVVGTTSGWEVGPGEDFNLDIKGSIPVYGIVASGTILIKVAELA